MRCGILLSTFAVLLPLALWASPSAGAPSTRAAAATAPESPGRWYYWSDCSTTHIVGYGKDSLWFQAWGLLWRYDVKTQTIRTFTPMDGLPLEGPRVVSQIAVAGDDKSCAIAFSGWGYLWRAKKGWRLLPNQEPKRRMGLLAYDPDGRLNCLFMNGPGKTTIYRWAGGQWQKVLDVPTCQLFMPLKGGYFLYLLQKGGPVFQPGNGQKPVAYEIPKGLSFRKRVFQTGGRTLGLFSAYRGRKSVSVLCRITPGKIVEESEGVGFDLTGNGYLKMVGPEDRGGRRVHGIGSTTDDKIADTTKGPRIGEICVRDANGHIWASSSRWDGRQWKLILPKQHLESHSDVMDRRMFVFDESKMTWKRINQNVAPAWRSTYDPATRTAWWGRRVEGREVFQHIRITGPKTEVLRTLPKPAGSGGQPQFKDPSGSWWGAGKGGRGDPAPFYACRYDKAGKAHVYPCNRGAAGGYRPQIQLSPGGKVWLWEEKNSLRYDPKQDKFVQAEPWDDFSFRFGPWELSIAGKVSSAAGGQQIYRKVDDRWVPLKNPFGGGVAWASRKMIFRDRMLITAAPIGVLEYDVTKDRWAVLSKSGFRAHFDEKGRRVLVNRSCVLLFDGDPFAPVDAKDKDPAILSELLKLMDDASWRVREKATQELKKLYPTVRGRLRAALGHKKLSLEVRLRIQELLREMKGGDSIPLVGLFRRMHPLVE